MHENKMQSQDNIGLLRRHIWENLNLNEIFRFYLSPLSLPTCRADGGPAIIEGIHFCNDTSICSTYMSVCRFILEPRIPFAATKLSAFGNLVLWSNLIIWREFDVMIQTDKQQQSKAIRVGRNDRQ